MEKTKNAVITIQGSVTRIPCFGKDEIEYYRRRLKFKGYIFTIHYLNNKKEVLDFMENYNEKIC